MKTGSRLIYLILCSISGLEMKHGSVICLNSIDGWPVVREWQPGGRPDASMLLILTWRVFGRPQADVEKGSLPSD